MLVDLLGGYCRFSRILNQIIIILRQSYIHMLKILSKIPILSPTYTNKLLYRISVYQGISPSLLATMSLSQGIKGNTNTQLISSLTKNNIISNKLLQQSMLNYDRKQFIAHDGKYTNYYQNKPYKISGGHNMTDIFTHAVVLQQICYHLQENITNKYSKQQSKNNKKMNVIDVGTGHGYLAFVLATLLPKLGYNQNNILAVDSSAAVINYAKKLQQKYISSNSHPQSKTISFQQSSVQNILDNKVTYNVIIGGFYMPPKFSEGLVNKMDKDNGFGVWAEDSSSGQSLYSIRRKQGKVIKNQIMSTMFSMPTVKTSVSNYFHDQTSQGQSQQQTKQSNSNFATNQAQNSQVNQQKLRQHLQSLKKQAKQKQKQQLKQQLKILITQHSAKLNRKLSLDQMRAIKQINTILEKLNGR